MRGLPLGQPDALGASPDSVNTVVGEPVNSKPSSDQQADRNNPRRDDKVELKERHAPDVLGFAFSTRRKWSILSVIFIVQCSMNFNASIYANGVGFLTDKFDITAQTARIGQMVFLISYAFGCELWAPWSEELGRWPTLQLSLLLVNIWQIPAALANNYTTVVVARLLGGLSSAGGSVTLGMVADMWDANEQQFAVAFVVFSSVIGSVIGPLVGPFIESRLSWEWICWSQLVFGLAGQVLHFLFVPETRSSILLDREARRLRQSGLYHIYGPSELKENRFSPRQIVKTWYRPFEMFVREPIVLCCSLLSGFSDALIFTFLEAFRPVYKQWDFNTEDMALTFIPIAFGYFIAYFSYFPTLAKQRRILGKNPDAPPELRLRWLLYLAPLETIGLFGFAWTSLGPPRIPWIAPMLFSMLVGIANYAIYMSTIDYMIAAYGPYAASATGGNGLARDLLAGVAAIYSTPFYTNVPRKDSRLRLEWPTTILGIIAVFVTIPIYVFYWKGQWFRENSKFAQTLSGEREKNRSDGDANLLPEPPVANTSSYDDMFPPYFIQLVCSSIVPITHAGRESSSMRKLYLVWAVLDLCLLAAGILSIVSSIVFASSRHLIVSLVFDHFDSRIGISLGALYILACALSIPAILQPKNRPVLLKALNVVLVALALVTLAFGTIVWVFSLDQLQNFSNIWARLDPQRQKWIQDTFSCCGYWNGTQAGQLQNAEGFCADAANSVGCVDIITSSKAPGSDYTLENVFSSVYGFELVIGLFFLTTVCIIKEHEVQVRYAKIDEKRGGGVFI